MHPVDESSPLFGCTCEDLELTDAEFSILMSGVDETFSQTVHARSSYKPLEILFGARFTNIYNPVAADGTVSIDVSRLRDVELVPEGPDLSFTETFRHTGHFTEGR